MVFVLVDRPRRVARQVRCIFIQKRQFRSSSSVCFPDFWIVVILSNLEVTFQVLKPFSWSYFFTVLWLVLLSEWRRSFIHSCTRSTERTWLHGIGKSKTDWWTGRGATWCSGLPLWSSGLFSWCSCIPGSPFKRPFPPPHTFSVTITHSPITLVNLSSINLVSIFRCSSPPWNPVYTRCVDPWALASS
jgi:hypothetical protein